MASVAHSGSSEGLIFGKTEDEVRAALDHAQPNALRIALYHATRDPELAQMGLSLTPLWGGAYEVPTLLDEHIPTLKQKALDFLKRGAPMEHGQASPAELRQMMSLLKGEPVSDYTFELGKVDLVEDEFPLGVEWNDEPSAEAKNRFRVVIVGAGFGGLATAIQLSRLGVPYTLIDRNSGPGGTWWTNDYPAARVDITSHQYQLSFMKKYPWKHYFATRDELMQYIAEVIDRYDLRPNMRFDTELKSATWDEGTSSWRLSVDTADGPQELVANAVVSSVGLFNAPKFPDIPGIEAFRGKMFHTTQWDHSYDYSGKRVGQIGVGATGAQLMPTVAQRAGHLTVFQRSPQWLSPLDGYLATIPDDVQWLFDHFPNYWNWFSFANFLTIGGAFEDLFKYDRGWQEQGGTVSRRNDAMREFNIEYVRSKLGHRPDLVKKLIPDFPPWTKRPVVDSGFYDALDRDNVDLVTDRIKRFTETGIETVDGTHRELDLVILCTGFEANRYLWPVQYHGRNGLTLEEAWKKDGPRAYLGITAPDFPNLFMLYGPNAQANAGGGVIKWLELWSRYSVRAIVKMIEQGITSMSVKPEVYEEFNKSLDDEMAKCIYADYGEISYYVNEHGRPGINSPWQPSVYFDWLSRTTMDDYNVK